MKTLFEVLGSKYSLAKGNGSRQKKKILYFEDGGERQQVENNQKEYNHEGNFQKEMHFLVEFQIYRPIEIDKKFNTK